MVMADFSRHLTLQAKMDWMAVSSYGSGTKSSGVVRILKDLDTDLHGRDVIIVEDIIDSGLTLSWLKQNLESRGAASVEIVTLLRKPEAAKVEVDVKLRRLRHPRRLRGGLRTRLRRALPQPPGHRRPGPAHLLVDEPGVRPQRTPILATESRPYAGEHATPAEKGSGHSARITWTSSASSAGRTSTCSSHSWGSGSDGPSSASPARSRSTPRRGSSSSLTARSPLRWSTPPSSGSTSRSRTAARPSSSTTRRRVVPKWSTRSLRPTSPRATTTPSSSRTGSSRSS